MFRTGSKELPPIITARLSKYKPDTSQPLADTERKAREAEQLTREVIWSWSRAIGIHVDLLLLLLVHDPVEDRLFHRLPRRLFILRKHLRSRPKDDLTDRAEALADFG